VKFRATPLAGAFIVELEPSEDERGRFARTFCEAEFRAHALNTAWPQMNASVNRRKGTLRGLHLQRAPHAETKLVRCVRGAIFDVMVDLREDSPTRLRWFGAQLNAENGLALYIPEGFAHGFQSLQDDCEVLYLMSRPFQASAAGGVRWNDPALKIAWPLKDPIVSEKDAALPLVGELR